MGKNMKEVPRRKKGYKAAGRVSTWLGDRMDGVVNVFSPGSRNRRYFQRHVLPNMLGYKGAEKDRIHGDWVPGSESADAHLLNDLPTMRQRSRDLNMNDPVASGTTETVTVNDIGTGITPQSRIDAERLGITEEQADEYQKAAEYSFDKWVPYADAAGRMSFFDMQHLIDRQMLETGEAFILPLRLEDPSRPYSLALQVIEGDRIATPNDKRSEKDIRSGIRIGDRGEEISFFVSQNHPGDSIYNSTKKTGYEEIPAFRKDGTKNMLHIYFLNRPGQTRGVPFFAPVLTRFKNLAGFLDAEIVAQRISACYALFIKTEGDPYGNAQGNANSTNPAGQRLEEFEPGLVKYLNATESVEQFKPERPGDNFDPFVEKMLRMIGASLQLPYEIVAKDFSKTNYSSARAALLQGYKYFKVRQTFLARHLCSPVWSLLLEEAYLKNELPVIDDFFTRRHDWTQVTWLPDGWEWVDPLKEVKAAVEAIESGLSTYSMEYGKRGIDWEWALRQRAREQKLIAKLGLQINTTPVPWPPSMPVDEEEGK